MSAKFYRAQDTFGLGSRGRTVTRNYVSQIIDLDLKAEWKLPDRSLFLIKIIKLWISVKY